jgi:hypothetical protein
MPIEASRLAPLATTPGFGRTTAPVTATVPTEAPHPIPSALSTVPTEAPPTEATPTEATCRVIPEAPTSHPPVGPAECRPRRRRSRRPAECPPRRRRPWDQTQCQQQGTHPLPTISHTCRISSTSLRERDTSWIGELVHGHICRLIHLGGFFGQIPRSEGGISSRCQTSASQSSPHARLTADSRSHCRTE